MDIDKLSDQSYSAAAEYAEPDSAWSARMLETAPNPDLFRAGRLNACAPVLERLLSKSGSVTSQARKVLTWIQKGIQLSFVPVNHASHDKAPNFHKKLQIVKRMLAQQ